MKITLEKENQFGDNYIYVNEYKEENNSTLLLTVGKADIECSYEMNKKELRDFIVILLHMQSKLNK